MYRFYRFLFLAFFKAFYFHRIAGQNHIPAGPCILAPNHASYLDPPLMVASGKEDFYFLAKVNLFKHFWFAKLLEQLHAYPVGGASNDLQSLKLICQLLKENKKIVIFPEGHRTPDGNFLPIKPGTAMIALKMDCPIIPVYIRGTFALWPHSRKFPKFWGRTSCEFGPPIYPEKFKHLTKKEAQEQISQELQHALERLKTQ